MRIRLLVILSALLLFFCNQPFAAVQNAKFVSGDHYLIVEILDDNLIHFELSGAGAGPDVGAPLYVSPMILKTDYQPIILYATGEYH